MMQVEDVLIQKKVVVTFTDIEEADIANEDVADTVDLEGPALIGPKGAGSNGQRNVRYFRRGKGQDIHTE